MNSGSPIELCHRPISGKHSEDQENDLEACVCLMNWGREWRQGRMLCNIQDKYWWALCWNQRAKTKMWETEEPSVISITHSQRRNLSSASPAKRCPRNSGQALVSSCFLEPWTAVADSTENEFRAWGVGSRHLLLWLYVNVEMWAICLLARLFILAFE